MMNDVPQILSASTASPASDGWRLRPATTGWLLALITLIALFLRLHALTARSFWLDEGLGIEIVRLPWRQFFHMIWNGEANMFLYYILLRFWLAIGSSEGFIRGLSVLFSVATVPIVFSLGGRLFGRRAGLTAALLLAINAYDIRYAQEARGYAMLVFFAVLATWLFVRNLQEPSFAHWEIYGVVCALTTYCHFFGALLVPAHAVAIVFWKRDEIPWRKFGRGVVVFGAMIVPVGLFALKGGGAPLSWVPRLQFDTLLVLGVYFSGNYGRLLLALDVIAAGIALIVARRVWQSGKRAKEGWGYALLLSWLIIPVAIVVAFSFVKPMFVPRFLILCLPALLLLVAVGISRCPVPALSLGLCAAILVCSILGDMNYYKYDDLDSTREDWRSVTSYVFERAQPGDNIFFYYAAGEAPFNYYSSRQESTALRPKTLQENWMKAEKRFNVSNTASGDLITVPGTDLRTIAPADGRVWLVLLSLTHSRQEAETGRAIGNWLSNGRSRIDVKIFSSLAVVLFDKKTAGSPEKDGRESVIH